MIASALIVNTGGEGDEDPNLMLPQLLARKMLDQIHITNFF